MIKRVWTVMLLFLVVGIIGGAFWYLQEPSPTGRCGDDICDKREQANPTLCPKDCVSIAVEMCLEKGGNICTSRQICSGSWLNAFDSDMCCSRYCLIAEEDIQYSSNNLNKLDIYHKEDAANAPIVILIHGGGWNGGDKKGMRKIGSYFAEKGFIAVTPNYRLAPEYAFPAQVKDVACAIAWIHNNADKYSADKSNMIVLGSSAGAQIGGMLAYDKDRDWLDECKYQADLNFIGFIGLSGAYDFDMLPKYLKPNLRMYLGDLFDPEDWKVAEPIKFVSEGDPPALLIHGNHCDGVNISVIFNKKLSSLGISSDLYIVPGYEHTDPRALFTENEEIMDRTNQFIDKVVIHN